MKNFLPTTFVIAICGCFVAPMFGQVTRSFAEPVERRHVAATQPDVVSKLLVREGDTVSVGDIIAELDNSVLRKHLQIAELRANSVSEIKAAEVKIETSRKRVEQLKPMLDKGHANPAEVDKAKAEFESAEAELELAREKKKEHELEVDRINAEIERNVIRSPIDGVVTEVHCRPGEFISSNERKLATVVQLKQLRVRFYLLQATTDQLLKNQKVQILFGTSQSPVTGNVEFVSPVIDPDSGTSRVDILIDNAEGELRSGSTCCWPSESKGFGSVFERGAKELVNHKRQESPHDAN